MTDKTDSKERYADALIRKLRDVLDECRSYIDTPTLTPLMESEVAIAVEEADIYLAGRASLATSGFDAADMATASAQGFRDGVASLAASAGSEPVARPKDAAGVREFVGSHFRSLFYANPVGIAPHDNDTYELTAHDLLSAFRWWAELHPSPPEGMVGGWMPIETAPKYTEHGVSQHLLLGYAPDEIHEDGFVSQGYWMEAEEDAPDNMGHDGGWVDVHFDFFRCGRSFGAEACRSAGTQPTHWMPLPPPPTSSADSRKGE